MVSPKYFEFHYFYTVQDTKKKMNAVLPENFQ